MRSTAPRKCQGARTQATLVAILETPAVSSPERARAMRLGQFGLSWKVSVCGSLGRRRFEHLPYLRFAFPAGPVLLVQLHEAGRPFNRLLLRLHVVHREATDQLLGLGERPVG